MMLYKRFVSVIFLALPVLAGRAQVIRLVFTSDVHYGIFRPHFRGADSVAADVVNRELIHAVQLLSKKEGPVDGLIITGDIANREEKGIQSAELSWRQFEANYMHPGVLAADGKETPLWITPGNHDISDAIGYHRRMEPLRDASSMAGIYNYMLHPAIALTKDSYDYSRNKIHYKKDIGGVHLLFLNLWPDSAERVWMDKDLDTLRAGVPVLLFAHSIPDVEARFFTNPHGDHAIDGADRFENLLPEFFSGRSISEPALAEQRGFVAWLKKHPAVRAYFHGHNNNNEFYSWHGPDNDISLPCFRVDSPMKGKFSAKDEKLLSFILISIDTLKKKMTVRECLWNSTPGDPSVLRWGEKTTLHL